MKRQIKVKGRILEYNVKMSPRAKNIRLHIYADGIITVTKPRYVSVRLADAMIRDNMDWLNEKLISLEKKREIAPGNYLKDKEAARQMILLRLEHFSNRYNLKYKKLSIRNQRTRWGSCSREGNLSFNYRLLHLRNELRDYIIVHELCHLVEFNHSKKFWTLVAQVIPNYEVLRKELKKMGMFYV